MLYYIDSSGVVQAAIPDTVTQGSVGVREIIIIAPFPTSTAVTAFITLPNGLEIYPQYVGREQIENGDYGYKFTPITAFEGKIPAPDGVTVNVWKLTLDRALTQIAGVVNFTFAFVDHLGNVLASTQATMNVGKATPYLNPTITIENIQQLSEYLSAAQQSAEDAQNSEEQALAYLNELKNTLLYFNKVVTDLDDLSEVASTASGRVLVRGVEFTRNETFTFNPSISLVEFEECSVPVNALSLTFETSGTCAIRGAAFALGEGVLTGTWNFNGFTAVEKCGRSSEYINCNYTNCTNITDCVIGNATNCTFIDNCVMYGTTAIPRLTSCRFINGIVKKSGVGNYVVTFSGCSFISNVNAEGQYESCTYVDTETCNGFISAADEGKVRTLTADGSFETAAIVAQTTLPNLLYATDASGNQTTVSYDKIALGNRVVRRTASGNIYLPETGPDNERQAVSQKYVDDAIAALGSGAGGGKLYQHALEIEHYDNEDNLIFVAQLTLYNRSATPITSITTEELFQAIPCKITDSGTAYAYLILVHKHMSEIQGYVDYDCYHLIDQVFHSVSYKPEDCTITDTVKEI